MLDKLDYQSIQIGLKEEVVKKYVKNWIIQIDNIADISKKIYQMILNNELAKAKNQLPNKKFILSQILLNIYWSRLELINSDVFFK